MLLITRKLWHSRKITENRMFQTPAISWKLRYIGHPGKHHQDPKKTRANNGAQPDRSTYTGKAEMRSNHRARITPGMEVSIVMKQDQHIGRLTQGVVRDILTKSPTHPHGIKVRLTSGAIGRVKAILSN
jgi:uncharacterized repeat protein (TIGR03833 family)